MVIKSNDCVMNKFDADNNMANIAPQQAKSKK